MEEDFDIAHNGSVYHDAKDTMGQEESRIEEVPDEVTALKRKLADETRLRQFTEQVLDQRQLELQAKETEYQRLTAKLDALRNELANAQTQLNETRNQAMSKEKQLLEAKDQIFRLQPVRQDITESEAIEGYRTLCANVQRWVENRLKTILDDLDFGRLKTRPAPGQAGRFVSLMREAAKRGLSLDQSDEYHVIAIMMNYLCLVFFSKSFYCSLDDFEGDSTLTFIDDLETSMSRLPRDAAHCKEWRSETLTALTSQQSFKTRRARYINQVTEDFATFLSIIVPKSSASDLQSSLRRNIIEPAADLAHQLHLAPSVFSLKWPARGAWARLEVYECLNLANGGLVLDLSGTTPKSPSRRKVSYLFDVAPGLFVERVEGGKKTAMKAICRPSVLVYGGDGEVDQKPTVLKWLWDSAGGAPGTARNPPPKITLSKKSFGPPPPGKRKMNPPER